MKQNSNEVTPTFVFVYGTLKQGHGNNRLLNRAKFVGPGTTVSEAFQMQDGGFPMVFAGGQFKVKGELFEVNDQQTLDNLDRLEGVPHFYNRQEVEVDVDGEIISAFMYVTNDRYQQGNFMVPNDNNVLEWNN